ncbi:MAG: hypothetical protein ACI9XB_001219, partial [Gammaproteobacteria bacterium]
ELINPALKGGGCTHRRIGEMKTCSSLEEFKGQPALMMTND